MNGPQPTPKCVKPTAFLALCFHLSVNNQVIHNKAIQEATRHGYRTVVESSDCSLIGFKRE